MPIEIRELVIRAMVDPAATGGSGGQGSCGMPQRTDGRNKSGAPADNGDSASPGGDLVQACVREVMRILERKEER